jgi:hypothetical protein
MPEHNTGHMGATMRLGKRRTVFTTKDSLLSKCITASRLPLGYNHKFSTIGKNIGSLSSFKCVRDSVHINNNKDKKQKIVSGPDKCTNNLIRVVAILAQITKKLDFIFIFRAVVPVWSSWRR